MPSPSTLAGQAADLAAGRVTARALVEQALERATDPAGEGQRTFISITAEPARAMADAMDRLHRVGRAPGPYAGLPISLKDLFDVAHEITRAGSRILAAGPPAASHAPVVQRLLTAGFVPMGRSNMSEFAFSALGLNPHYGTPRNPWDRASGGRIPGGSSSGAAVSVSDGMAIGAIGSDTGGSCRIPAALCGIVGFKPTARRIPTAGTVPLSPTLDSIGPLANSVACCAVLDAVMAGEPVPAPDFPPAAPELQGLRFLVPSNLVLDSLDDAVAAPFERALRRLADAGAVIEQREMPALDRIAEAHTYATFAIVEAYAWHRRYLGRDGALYDPFVRARIEPGAGVTAAQYLDLVAARAAITRTAARQTADYHAVVMPTVPLIAPRLADVADPAEARRVNALLLRNTAIGNFLDRCAISLPCHRAGDPPAGLMLMGETAGDAALFRVARSVAAALGV